MGSALGIGIGAAVASAAGVCAYAAVAPGSQLFGPVLVAGADANQIALTYDDGPNPAVTPRLLEVLAKSNVRATFFLIGNYVRLEPGLVREIVAAGHTVGNHTMSHPRLPLLSARRIHEEIAGAKALIEDTVGAPVRLFRPPYGQRRPAVLRIARELGMVTVQWNVMVGDWKPVSAETLLERLVSGVERNKSLGVASNVVLHDGGEAGLGQPRMATVEATRLVIERYRTAAWVTPEAWL